MILTALMNPPAVRLLIALASVLGVFVIDWVAALGCYAQDLQGAAWGSAVFVGIPMAPAIIGLLCANPLRATVASAFFLPWLLLAIGHDCLGPPSGGGASMIFLLVLVFGLLSCASGLLLSYAMPWLKLDPSDSA